MMHRPQIGRLAAVGAIQRVLEHRSVGEGEVITRDASTLETLEQIAPSN
jgi:hypothetical protein